ncbi:MAG: hypothetical protein V1859_05305 [archaeon]
MLKKTSNEESKSSEKEEISTLKEEIVKSLINLRNLQAHSNTDLNTQRLFLSILQKGINNYISYPLDKHEITNNNLNSYLSMSNKADTMVRISRLTKNNLKNLMKPEETYDELISRLILFYDSYKNELESLKSQNTLIDFVTEEFQRQRKTLTYYQDIKIEYSYNIPNKLFSPKFIFKLEIDNILHKGVPMNKEEGIKLLLIVSLVKSLKKLVNSNNIDEILKKKEIALEDKAQLIRTNYLIYFKILYLVINKNSKKKYLSEDELLTEDYWKRVYGYYELSDYSFDMDIKRKLNQFEAEIRQFNINSENINYRV